jgi:hypothetical protein
MKDHLLSCPTHWFLAPLEEQGRKVAALETFGQGFILTSPTAEGGEKVVADAALARGERTQTSFSSRAVVRHVDHVGVGRFLESLDRLELAEST